VTSLEHDTHNRDFLRATYLASLAGDADAFPKVMSPGFEADVSPQLPWGGVHRGVDEFVNVVLPQLAAAIDFSSMRLVSVSADGERAAALLNARTTQGADFWLAEHWVIQADKLQRLRVFCFDTQSVGAAASAPTTS
jgi:ketosteroid isomerase-like protein